MLNSARSEQLICLCQEFVRIPSTSGKEEKIARSITTTARALGYDHVSVDNYGNVLMRVRFSEGGPRLLFHVQMDHVEPGDSADWAFYPYSAEIRRKKIHGSGSMDQKGSLAAMILAGAFLKEERKGFNLKGELIVAAAVQQEHFDSLAARSIAIAVKPDAVVIGDATNMNIIRGQPGSIRIVLEIKGRMAHVLSPKHGINAAEKMISVLDTISKKYIPPYDPFLGEGTLVLTGLLTDANIPGKIIPDKCTSTLVKRTLLGETCQSSLEVIKSLVLPLSKKDRGLFLTVSVATTEGRCYTGATLATEQFVPAWATSPDHPFISSTQLCLKKAGFEVPLSKTAGFGTSGAQYGGEQGLPTLLFGPGQPEKAHRIDEFLEIEQLLKACQVYFALADGFLKGELCF